MLNYNAEGVMQSEFVLKVSLNQGLLATLFCRRCSVDYLMAAIKTFQLDTSRHTCTGGQNCYICYAVHSCVILTHDKNERTDLTQLSVVTKYRYFSQ